MMEKPWGGSWQWCFLFFEEGPGGLFRRVNQETLGMHQELLTLAELLQTVGGIEVPLDPSRTVAQTEVLVESFFQDLEILRMVCTLEPAAPGVHIYSLGLDLNAEDGFAHKPLQTIEQRWSWPGPYRGKRSWALRRTCSMSGLSPWWT